MSSPSTKTIKKLCALSGNTCAFPKCTTLLVDEESNSFVGEVCHIEGKRPYSARYDLNQKDEERDAFENLILMCPTHHKIIDDDSESYTVEWLQQIKSNCELRYIANPELNSTQEKLIELLEKHLRLVEDNSSLDIEEENSILTKWTKNEGVNIAASSQAIPDFPFIFPEYRAADSNKDYWGNPFSWSGTDRLFELGGWTEIWNFPHTMNHCSYGRFMIRWRSANPNVLVETAVGYSKSHAIHSQIGTFGYMLGTVCEQPLFNFAYTLNNNKANLVDIYYELKFWQAAP
jgi:hypothetical protein